MIPVCRRSFSADFSLQRCCCGHFLASYSPKVLLDVYYCRFKFLWWGWQAARNMYQACLANHVHEPAPPAVWTITPPAPIPRGHRFASTTETHVHFNWPFSSPTGQSENGSTQPAKARCRRKAGESSYKRVVEENSGMVVKGLPGPCLWISLVKHHCKHKATDCTSDDLTV